MLKGNYINKKDSLEAETVIIDEKIIKDIIEEVKAPINKEKRKLILNKYLQILKKAKNT